MDNNTSFLNRHNARESLKVLTNYMSLSKNMKTVFLHSTLIQAQCSTHKAAFQWTHDTAGLFYWPLNMQYMWFSYLRYTTIVTSWKYGNRYSSNTPCTPKVILVQFSHNLHVQKSVWIPQSFVHLFTHLFPPRMIFIINECLKYYSINYHFFKYYINIIFNARNYQRQLLKLHSGTK